MFLCKCRITAEKCQTCCPTCSPTGFFSLFGLGLFADHNKNECILCANENVRQSGIPTLTHQEVKLAHVLVGQWVIFSLMSCGLDQCCRQCITTLVSEERRSHFHSFICFQAWAEYSPGGRVWWHCHHFTSSWPLRRPSRKPSLKAGSTWARLFAEASHPCGIRMLGISLHMWKGLSDLELWIRKNHHDVQRGKLVLQRPGEHSGFCLDSNVNWRSTFEQNGSAQKTKHQQKKTFCSIHCPAQRFCWSWRPILKKDRVCLNSALFLCSHSFCFSFVILCFFWRPWWIA